MRQPPKWTEFYKYPVIAGISVLAIGSTLAWWTKADVSPMFETAMIRRGELWRLLTSALLHQGLLHLIFNLYWFWIFGTLVEEVFGHVKTAALILLFASGSGSLEFALANGGVGLSGVGYGLFAMLWVLSKRDERFRDAMDLRTAQLFVGWFILCIVTTLAKWYPVANIAHATGAVLGCLVAVLIAIPARRILASVVIAAILCFGLWGSTLGRPRVNLSASGGFEEGKWGYDALQAQQNQQAIRWLREATIYQPKLAVYWFDLGIAYERAGDVKEATASYSRAHQLEPGNAEYSKYAASK
jgi:membrane associated rhomboid family serine protease